MLCSLNLGDRDRVVVIWLARAQACLPHAIHWHTQDHRRIASARIAPRTQVSQGFFDIAQDRNSSNLGPETRFSCARGRTRKLCGSISFVEGLAETQRACAEKPCAVIEALSRKQLSKSSRKPFAEATAEGGNKKTTSATRGRIAEGLRGSGSFCSEIIYRNKNQNSGA